MKIKIYQSAKDKQWYFRIVARNGRIVAQGEGYKRKASLVKTLNKLTIAMVQQYVQDGFKS